MTTGATISQTNRIYDSLLHGREIVASDGHYKTDQYVSFRVDRRLRTESSLRVSREMTQAFLESELDDKQLARLEADGYVDLGLDFRDRKGLERLGRLRISARYAYARKALNLAVRYHASRIFEPSEFDLGDYVERELLVPHRGLDLISAPMGMTKTSLRAALLQELNRRYGVTITSYEDPIELLLTPVKGSIEQIEIGPDVESFFASEPALRRTDTDIVSYGELRDQPTKRAALNAAKSMHVIATSFAASAVEAIDDYIEGFPPQEQSEVRSGLANALHSVTVLRALPRAPGRQLPVDKLNGRQNIRVAAEILHVNDTVKALIRRSETHRIRVEQQGPGREFGSRTLEAHMAALAAAGEISVDDPLVRREIRNEASFQSELKRLTAEARR